jgi:hypothetical protein
MNLNVDSLINFFEKYSQNKENELPLEEQDDTGGKETSPQSATSSSGGSGKSPKKWESGASRGKANPTANTVWASGRKFGKTYMNDPKSVWNTGLTRGKANSLYYD